MAVRLTRRQLLIGAGVTGLALKSPGLFADLADGTAASPISRTILHRRIGARPGHGHLDYLQRGQRSLSR